jgi:hypothetical protein
VKCLEIWDAEIRLYHGLKPGDPEKFEREFAEVETVVNHWKALLGKQFRSMLRKPTEYYGNTYNVLEAYKEALASEARYVYLVEDDVIVHPDFFKWHEAAQTEGCFCSVGGNCDRNIHPYFASLGVCWSRQNLATVVEHAYPMYYERLLPYVMRTFPQSKMGCHMIEQDGLVSRIIERDNHKVLWADPAVCSHVGLWGYHRSIGPEAMIAAGLGNVSLEQKIANLRVALRNKEWIESVSEGQTDIDILK